MRYFLLLILLMSSCGKSLVRPINPYDTTHSNKVEIDKAFDEYVDDFEDDWGLDVTDLVMEFETIEQDPETTTTRLGVCYTRHNTTPRVIIGPETWVNMDETRRKLLIYHELGHCVLFRKHIEGTNTSIMNPILLSSAVFKKNEDYFINELFDETKYSSLNLRCRHNHGE